jgi:hypothetical protein
LTFTSSRRVAAAPRIVGIEAEQVVVIEVVDDPAQALREVVRVRDRESA